MRVPLAGCVALSVGLLSPGALAKTRYDADYPPIEPDVRDDGVELSARLSYAFPGGRTDGTSEGEGSQLDSLLDGLIAMHVDLGYRFDEHWFVGGYWQYGIGFGGAPCDAADEVNGSCTPTSIRTGLFGSYHILGIRETVAPWVGLGAGYEWTQVRFELPPDTTTLAVRGFEIVNFQAGADFQWTETLRVGPVATLALGQFSNVRLRFSNVEGNGEDSASIEDKALHTWLFLGVRGTFGPLWPR